MKLKILFLLLAMVNYFTTTAQECCSNSQERSDPAQIKCYFAEGKFAQGVAMYDAFPLSEQKRIEEQNPLLFHMVQAMKVKKYSPKEYDRHISAIRKKIELYKSNPVKDIFFPKKKDEIFCAMKILRKIEGEHIEQIPIIKTIEIIKKIERIHIKLIPFKIDNVAMGTPTYQLSISYKEGKYKLTKEDEKELDKLAVEFHKTKGNGKITISSYTTESGSDNTNNQLCQDRLNEVKEYLKLSKKISILSMEFDKTPRIANRRAVDVKLYAAK